MYHLYRTDHYLNWERRLRDRTALATITARLARLAYGHLGDTKPVGNGVLELRIHLGPGYRIYFTIRDQQIVLLLSGGDKSSQVADIDLAKRLKRELEQ